MTGYKTPEEWESGPVLPRKTWEVRKLFCPLCHARMRVTDTSIPHEDTIAIRCDKCGHNEVHFVRPVKKPSEEKTSGRLIKVDFTRR